MRAWALIPYLLPLILVGSFVLWNMVKSQSPGIKPRDIDARFPFTLTVESPSNVPISFVSSPYCNTLVTFKLTNRSSRVIALPMLGVWADATFECNEWGAKKKAIFWCSGNGQLRIGDYLLKPGESIAQSAPEDAFVLFYLPGTYDVKYHYELPWHEVDSTVNRLESDDGEIMANAGLSGIQWLYPLGICLVIMGLLILRPRYPGPQSGNYTGMAD